MRYERYNGYENRFSVQDLNSPHLMIKVDEDFLTIYLYRGGNRIFMIPYPHNIPNISRASEQYWDSIFFLLKPGKKNSLVFFASVTLTIFHCVVRRVE